MKVCIKSHIRSSMASNQHSPNYRSPEGHQSQASVCRGILPEVYQKTCLTNTGRKKSSAVFSSRCIIICGLNSFLVGFDHKVWYLAQLEWLGWFTPGIFSIHSSYFCIYAKDRITLFKTHSFNTCLTRSGGLHREIVLRLIWNMTFNYRLFWKCLIYY